MNVVEEGVANFRSFQADARDFFSRADERAQVEAEFHNKRDQEIKDALLEANSKLNARIGIASLIVGVLLVILAILALPELNHVLHGDLSRGDPGWRLASTKNTPQISTIPPSVELNSH